MLHIDGGNASGAGSRDGLAVGGVEHVTGGKNTGDGRCRGTAVHGNGAVHGQFQLILDQINAGIGADGHEQAGDIQLRGFSGHGVLQGQGLHLGLTVDVLDLLVPQDVDFGIIERALLHDFRGAERIAAVDQGHLGRKLGQEGRLLDRGVAAVLDGHGLDLALQLQGCDVLETNVRTEALGLLLHIGHQIRPHDAFDETRVVLDIRGVHEFTTGGDGAGDHDGLEVRASGVNSGGVTGGSRTDDDHVVDGVVGGGGGGLLRLDGRQVQVHGVREGGAEIIAHVSENLSGDYRVRGGKLLEERAGTA